MKIDLCKIFGVEEGEEFRLEGEGFGKCHVYEIRYNRLMYRNTGDGVFLDSSLKLKELKDITNIIKLPKKKQFTDDELCILRNVYKKYKWIARDEDGELYLFKEKPCKSLGVWETKSTITTEFLCYNYLFQSITLEDEEPVFIDDYVER